MAHLVPFKIFNGVKKDSIDKKDLTVQNRGSKVFFFWRDEKKKNE